MSRVYVYNLSLRLLVYCFRCSRLASADTCVLAHSAWMYRDGKIIVDFLSVHRIRVDFRRRTTQKSLQLRTCSGSTPEFEPHL